MNLSGRRLCGLLAITLMIVLILISFQVMPAWAEGELVTALKNRELFLNSKEKQEKRAEWLNLIKEFEDAAMAQYNPRHASRARYLGAELALDSALKFKQPADYAAAARLGKRAVRDCPHCPHSPDAQLIYGRALMAQDQLDQATKELMKVELNYPDSPEVAEARKHLGKLRGGPPPVPENKAARNEAEKNPVQESVPGSAESGGKSPDQTLAKNKGKADGGYMAATVKNENNKTQPPRAELKPAPKAETKTESKPAPKSETKTESKPAPKAEAKAESKPSPKAEAKVESKPVPKAEAKAESKPAPKAEAKVKTAPRPKAPSKPAARADGKAHVYGLELWDRSEYTQVTAYVDKVTPYVYNLIPPSRNGGSFRVYADLKGAVIAPKTKVQLPSGNTLIKLVKMNQFKEDVVRVVMDMPEAHHYRPTFLDDPPRLVFQVAREADKLPAQVAEAQPDPPEETAPKTALSAPDKEKSPPARPVKGPDESLARQLGLKVKTVVIDPGHGGKDLGTSKNGLKEKDIVLSLSKKLAARIEKRLNVKVILTRDEDRFITLERRTKIAKDKMADLFISLHVNANDLAEVEGFETYVLNFATDRSAMAVAARENAQSDKSVAELQDLLHIIARNTKIAESRAMAQTLHKAAVANINKKFKLRDLGVKEAPFYVLVGTDVPSILVEIGFITNAKDAVNLSQEAYLDAVADGLAQGLENYVKGF